MPSTETPWHTIVTWTVPADVALPSLLAGRDPERLGQVLAELHRDARVRGPVLTVRGRLLEVGMVVAARTIGEASNIGIDAVVSALGPDGIPTAQLEAVSQPVPDEATMAATLPASD